MWFSQYMFFCPLLCIQRMSGGENDELSYSPQPGTSRHFSCVLEEDQMPGTGGNCDRFSDGFIFFSRDPLLIWEEVLLMGQEQNWTELINPPEILYESEGGLCWDRSEKLNLSACILCWTLHFFHYWWLLTIEDSSSQKPAANSKKWITSDVCVCVCAG